MWRYINKHNIIIMIPSVSRTTINILDVDTRRSAVTVRASCATSTSARPPPTDLDLQAGAADSRLEQLDVLQYAQLTLGARDGGGGGGRGTRAPTRPAPATRGRTFGGRRRRDLRVGRGSGGARRRAVESDDCGDRTEKKTT